MKKIILIVFIFVFLLSAAKIESEIIVDTRAEIIDNYYKERNMPLYGYGKKMVEVADKYNLDWRLLPAISIRETSGGKYMCRSFNAFGWGSCRIEFRSQEEAIETIGYKLSNLPVYQGKTTKEKLYYYNGTVVKSYPDEVISIMNKIKAP